MELRDAIISPYELSHASGGAFGAGDNLGTPPIEKVIIKNARAGKTNIDDLFVNWELIEGYSATGKLYKIKTEYINKIKDITDLINQNKGKPLTEVLKIELP